MVQNWVVVPKFPYASMILMFVRTRQYHIDKLENSMQPVTTNGTIKHSTKRISFFVFPWYDSSVRPNWRQELTRSGKKQNFKKQALLQFKYAIVDDISRKNFELRSDVDHYAKIDFGEWLETCFRNVLSFVFTCKLRLNGFLSINSTGILHFYFLMAIFSKTF